MGDSCGSKRRRMLSVGVKIGRISSDGEEISGNVKQIDLPHLVVGKILENLKFKDLLQCSLVNKVWNHEARRLLREKHRCALTVDLDKPAAKQIMELNTMVAAAEWPLPYGSISIRKKEKYINEQEYFVLKTRKGRELVEGAIKNIILKAGPFEFVKLNINCSIDISVEACIIRKLLAEVQKTVEVLIVKNLDGSDLFENVTRLPELKKLEIYLDATINDPDVRRIQNIVKYSEKLENVGHMSSKWLKLLETVPPARKLVVVKDFTCFDMYNHQGRAAEFAKLEPKLEELCIPRQQYNPSWNQRSRSISMSILQSSRASLIRIQVTYEILQQIRREKPFTLFDNLRYLIVDAPCGVYREDVERNHGFIALFPKLEELKVITETPHYDNIFDDDY